MPAEARTAVLYREMDLRVDAEELARRKAARASAAADGASGDDKETIPVAISSEKSVLRRDWWDGERYYEVLDHAPDSIDLSYATDGLPFVMSHRSWDGDSQHGLVEGVKADKDRVLRGDLRMSHAARSQEIADDIVRGIRKKVSVGYIVGDEYEETTPDGPDSIPTRRYTAWMPIEVSVVPVPADYDGSGFGRSAGESGDDVIPPPIRDAIERYLQRHPLHRATRSTTIPAADKAKEQHMPEAAAASPAASVITTDRAQDQHDPEKLGQIATQYGVQDRLPSWLAKKATTEAALRETTDALAGRAKQPIKQELGVDGLSEKDARRYSYARAIFAQMDPRTVKEMGVDIGLEREVGEFLRGKSPKAGNGLMVPLSLRAGLDATNATKGPELKFTQPGDFIELLRNRMAVTRAGATFLSGLTGPVSFPAQNASATAAWQGENPGSDASDSNLTLTTVALAFKTLISSTSFSRQLLFSAASGGFDAEQIVRNDLAKVIALALDVAALTGSGTGQPLGLLNNTSIGSVTLGAQGGTVGWNQIVDLETAIADANADISTMSYITNTKQRGVMKKVTVLGNTAGAVPIWGQGTNPDGVVNGYRAVASNQVPRNLTKGTQTTVCSAIIFGAFDQLIIGQFGPGVEILVDELRLKKQAMVEVTQMQYADICIKYAAAFAAIKDAL